MLLGKKNAAVFPREAHRGPGERKLETALSFPSDPPSLELPSPSHTEKSIDVSVVYGCSGGTGPGQEVAETRSEFS